MRFFFCDVGDDGDDGDDDDVGDASGVLVMVNCRKPPTH